MADIGNLKIALSASTEGLKKGMQEAVTVVETSGKKLGEAAKAASGAVDAGMNQAGKSTQSLRAQFRSATQDAQRMAEQFGTASHQFRAAAQSAGELKDQIGDVNNIINLLSQDSPGLAMIGHSMKIAGSFTQAAAGAMGLLGDNSKETQEMLLKVQSAMAFGQGIAQLGELQDSFKALSTAIMLNPLAAGAVAAAVVAATVAYIAYNNSITDAERAQVALNAAQQEGMVKAQDELVHLNTLVAIARDVSQSTQTRQAAINELNSKYPQYLKNLSLENINSQQAARGIDMATEAIKRRAMAQALEQKIVELSKQRTEKLLSGPSAMDLVLGFGSGQRMVENRLNEIKSIDNQIQLLTKELTKYGNEVVSVDTKVAAATHTESKATTQLAKKTVELKKATQETRKKQDSISIGTPTTQQPGELSLIQPGTGGVEAIQKAQADARAKLQADAQQLMQLSNNINAQFASAIAGTIGGFAEVTGAALAGAAVSFQSFGDMALQAISGFMKQMGQQMLEIGTAKIITDSLISIPFAGPGLVAAGTALIVAASFAATKANSSPMRGASGVGNYQQGGTNQQSGGSIRLAKGGLAYAPTLATVGDNRGASYNPEVIAPLSELERIMGNSGGGNVHVGGRIYGEDILLTGVRSGQKMGRKGMRF